jgi:hypothetical protein
LGARDAARTLEVKAVMVGGIISAVGIVVIAGGGTVDGARTLLRW